VRQLEELNAPASISTFVLAELMVSFEKSDIGSIPVTLREIEKSFSPIVELSKDIAISAAKIRSSSKITLGDAIVIASALDQDSELLTFDKNMKAVYERIKETKTARHYSFSYVSTCPSCWPGFNHNHN